MKILMTADTLGGVWTYAIDLARALQSYPAEIALATMGRPLDRRQRREVAHLPHVQVYESEYKLEWMDAPWDDVDDAGRWLQRVGDQVEPDLVHLNNYAHGVLDWQTPVVMVGHSCVLSWWRAVKGEAAPARYQEYRRRVQAGLCAADLVVAPTQAMLSALCHHYGPFERSCVIANGRHTDPFAPAPKEPFILSVGRLWDHAKNVAALEAVAPQLPWPVRVAGEEADPDGRRHDPRNVQPLGHLTTADLADQMARASIYALPARYEPFGLSALEAALSGCALVLGDIPSLREVWGAAALYVAPGDTGALLRTLHRLIEDDALRQRYGQRALRRAQRYTPHKMGITYWAVYQILRLEAAPPVPVRTLPHLDLPQAPAFPSGQESNGRVRGFKSKATLER